MKFLQVVFFVSLLGSSAYGMNDDIDTIEKKENAFHIAYIKQTDTKNTYVQYNKATKSFLGFEEAINGKGQISPLQNNQSTAELWRKLDEKYTELHTEKNTAE